MEKDLWPLASHLVPLLPSGPAPSLAPIISRVRMVQISFTSIAEVEKRVKEIKKVNPGVVVSVRLILDPQSEENVVALEGAGIEVLHLLADERGRERQTSSPRFIKDLTLFLDLRYDPGKKRRSCLQEILLEGLEKILSAAPDLSSDRRGVMRRIDGQGRDTLRKPNEGERVLIVDARGFAAEGKESVASLLIQAYHRGWKKFIVYGCQGQRFFGCGLGPGTQNVHLDVYGSSGDYLGSGIDGLEIFVHGNAQDQLGQIMKSGKMVIYGDVGQTFLYGAKGGAVYVLGNAAGRPLINAAGKPRVVINGTCLDYLAESFMAGDPLQGGGFVILNGVEFDEYGKIREQPTPFPGSNLFSLASGGAIYVRDPHSRLEEEQLNGGEFTQLTEKDWQLIQPYLQENENLFQISIDHDLLAVEGKKRRPEEVYRKVRAVKLSVLSSTKVEE